MSSLHQRLRAETRAAHENLERSLDWPARLASLAAYADWLARLYGFHRAWEQAAGAHLPASLLAARRRAHLAATDLAHLGWSSAGIADLTLCPLPALTGRAGALGVLYVVEGSALGGQVIAREVERRLGLRREGCRYFQGYGRATGALWREVRTELALLPLAEGDVAVRAALHTFEILRAWLHHERAPEAPRAPTSRVA